MEQTSYSSMAHILLGSASQNPLPNTFWGHICLTSLENITQIGIYAEGHQLFTHCNILGSDWGTPSRHFWYPCKSHGLLRTCPWTCVLWSSNQRVWDTSLEWFWSETLLKISMLEDWIQKRSVPIWFCWRWPPGTISVAATRQSKGLKGSFRPWRMYAWHGAVFIFDCHEGPFRSLV